MQEVDVIGTSSIASLIEQSGLTKFLIQKTGAGKNSTPVFEFIKTTATNKQAKDTFLQWSSNILQGGNNNNVYEILLFNDVDIVENGSGEEEISRTKKKSNKMRFSFTLSPFQQERSMGVLNGYGAGESTADMIRMAVENALSERDKLDLKKELQELRSEIEEMRNEEDEDLGEDKGNPLMNQLGALLIAKLSPDKNTPVVINGTPDEKEENIARAINVLWKHDSQLDSDLLKLGAVAESNPSQFNFLLSALRNL
jgi:hypothetical protein